MTIDMYMPQHMYLTLFVLHNYIDLLRLALLAVCCTGGNTDAS